MANFCGKCGSKLESSTGLCPRCDRTVNATVQNDIYFDGVDEETPTSMTFGQKFRRGILRIFFWIVLWAALVVMIAGGLAHLGIIDIPVVDDIVREVKLFLHKEHEWLDATCVDPRICEVCNETEGKPLGHSWIPSTCTDPQRCSVCGEIGDAATGHDWIEATYSSPRMCSVCHVTDGEPLKDPAVDILNTAAAYAQNNEYRKAIQLLDESWKQLGNQELYDAAAQYRKEFGIHNSRYIAAGKYNTFLLQGTDVEACGEAEFDELDSRKWKSITAISAGDRHVVGLRSNGTVVAEGANKYGECDVSHWNNIAAVYAGDYHTVVLKQDGTIDAVGFNDRDQCQVDKILSAAGDRKIVSIAAGLRHTLALLEDGTVAACGKPWSKRATEVTEWTDIAAIYAGSDFSAGLKTDGTVVVCGSDISGEKDLSRVWDLSLWTDIVALAAGDYYLVGLRADGTVLTTGGFETDLNAEEHEVMNSWKDIVHISAGRNHTVALTKTGKVLCAGSNSSGQCSFNGKTIETD